MNLTHPLPEEFSGGYLWDALRFYGALSEGQVTGVLLSVLEALHQAPATAAEYTCLHRWGFALDAQGVVHVVPHTERLRTEVNPRYELGEIAYMALTGRTWEESGVPLVDVPHIETQACADLISDLLDTAITTLGMNSVIVTPEASVQGEHRQCSSVNNLGRGHILPPDVEYRLLECAPARACPFMPARADTSIHETPTAQLLLPQKTVQWLWEAATVRAEQQRTLSACIEPRRRSRWRLKPGELASLPGVSQCITAGGWIHRLGLPVATAGLGIISAVTGLVFLISNH